jgi:hypothetical protein
MLCRSSLEICLKSLLHYNADLATIIAHTSNPSLIAWYKFRQSQNDSVIGEIRKIIRSLDHV